MRGERREEVLRHREWRRQELSKGEGKEWSGGRRGRDSLRQKFVHANLLPYLHKNIYKHYA